MEGSSRAPVTGAHGLKAHLTNKTRQSMWTASVLDKRRGNIMPTCASTSPKEASFMTAEIHDRNQMTSMMTLANFYQVI